MTRSFDGKRQHRRLAVGLALAGVLLVAGCGVRSQPKRPGDYKYPADYPTAVDDPIVAPGDAPTLGNAPRRRGGTQGGTRDSYSGTGTPPPATETITR